jgi:putative MATE family efflux protein
MDSDASSAHYPATTAPAAKQHTSSDAARSDQTADASGLPLSTSLSTSLKKPLSKSRPDILHGAITPTLWGFTLPLTFSFVVNIVYSWIDTYFVSHLGAAAIAAIGFCEQLNFAIFTIATGFVVGTGIIIARRIGEGNADSARRVAAQSIGIMMGFSLCVACALWLSIPVVLPLFGLKSEVLHYATQYMRTVVLGVPGIFFIFHLNVIMRSAGDSAFSMQTLLISTTLNAVFAPVLVFGVDSLGLSALGMAGAGLATALAQLCGAGYGFYAAFTGKSSIRLPMRLPKPEWVVVRSIVALGVPSSLQFIAISISRVCMIAIANLFGTSVAAAYTLGLKIDFFVYMPVFAVGVALESITGQNLGARQIKRIFQFYRAAVWQMVALTGALGLVAFAAGHYFVRLFTDEPDIIRIASSYLQTVAFGYPLFAAAVVSVRIVSGAGDTIRAMAILGGMSLIVQLPLVYGLSHWTSLSYSGIWVGVVISYFLMSFVAVQAVFGRKWLMAKI